MIICWGGLAGADYAQKMIICWGDLLVLITRLENIRLMYRPTERTYQAVRTRLKNIRLIYRPTKQTYQAVRTRWENIRL